ncbi:MAG: DUF302 domain-containing protein [candidate division Zixibacteria bacterium]|nr:DUF302 domain-containing protein [candidate division Zixibacteria bacterium]
MTRDFAYSVTTGKPFAEVVAAFERLVPENQFRILHTHDVQATLAQKSFQRGPLKIIEVCNAGFAHKALQINMDVALFMPCRYTVYEQNGKTTVSLAWPSMISQMLPETEFRAPAEDVEAKLIAIMKEAIR